ncbi:ribbon-helix-helix protein, CopG family [Glaesserella parasuis]|uniref:Ribbon-helix-helix protein, CopG family n=4 Tax=Glaesserella parasuis TaxID=738 RepID=A0A6I5WS71_GLAPU|nr:hypothetical protein [Glaesserella parasuis]AGO16048.1 hypothetical protein K756_04175 [Glaesserella parasuis ZJ0906]ACL32234.1 hypothetical phage protein [Glaesserella parasuis SH0165]AIK16528.1 hypothetical protein JL26_01100 [Glaesserella parasuis]AIK90998.1 hypothetical protein JT17_10105 [Glaesserella parasuis]ATW45488.1 ribbon-helix-helix protein, CopG family [Glaesserella parasuis str. Nagasaki]
MAMSRTEIVKRSEEKHGIKLKAFKLPLVVIAEIEQLSTELNIPQNQLIIQAVELFKQSQKGA